MMIFSDVNNYDGEMIFEVAQYLISTVHPEALIEMRRVLGISDEEYDDMIEVIEAVIDGESSGR